MKVVGFSFVRNAIKLDYPVVEAINSILPLCDEVIVAVGNSDDDTLNIVQALDPQKIKIIPTIWDDSLRTGGRVLAVETDKAFAQVTTEADWAFYIQADEVVHEKDYDAIRKAMLQWKDNPKVEGLLFKYLHFYGSYDYVGDSRKWYRNEIRIIRPKKDIFAYRDAQGFRKKPNEKLTVKPIEAHIYHYGWVREPFKQLEKQKAFQRLSHDDEWLAENIPQQKEFDYRLAIDSLQKFKGTHPTVMHKRIANISWKFEYDINQKNYDTRVALLMWLEKYTGWRIGEYKNYKII
ncbi:MAG: glycosyltransferase family 2 protein [Cytophagales bacterium]|nr:MAG: glycosyltransferase family 2 protein [Cytophagales bacterium]